MRSLLLVSMLLTVSFSLMATPKPSEVVQNFIQAYNKHDAGLMVSYTTDNVTWMHVTGKKIEVETSTKAEFAAAMTDYFESLKGAKASILDMIESGHYVSTLEKVTWKSDGEELSQCSIGTFRVKAGKLAEFWYFPAHSCDEQGLKVEVEPEVGILQQTKY